MTQQPGRTATVGAGVDLACGRLLIHRQCPAICTTQSPTVIRRPSHVRGPEALASKPVSTTNTSALDSGPSRLPLPPSPHRSWSAAHGHHRHSTTEPSAYRARFLTQKYIRTFFKKKQACCRGMYMPFIVSLTVHAFINMLALSPPLPPRLLVTSIPHNDPRGGPPLFVVGCLIVRHGDRDQDSARTCS